MKRDHSVFNQSISRQARGSTRRALKALLAIAPVLLIASAMPVGAQGFATYADVAPIFAKYCVLCHAGQAPAAGLRLDTFDAALKGGTKGAVLKAGATSESELVRRIKGISQPRMPMTGPPFLADSEVATIERWIAGGLQPGDVAATAPTTSAGPRRPQPGENVTYLHVAPILATRCAKCHMDGGLRGAAPEDYRLTSFEATLSTADRARVVPGHPNASELVRRIRGQARPRMPLDGPYLDGDEIKLIEDWIAQGARNAEGTPSRAPAGTTVRLHGTIKAGGQLEGVDLVVGPRTRVDKVPVSGDYVEVRGTLDAKGRVVVERLSPR